MVTGFWQARYLFRPVICWRDGATKLRYLSDRSGILPPTFTGVRHSLQMANDQNMQPTVAPEPLLKLSPGGKEMFLRSLSDKQATSNLDDLSGHRRAIVGSCSSRSVSRTGQLSCLFRRLSTSCVAKACYKGTPPWVFQQPARRGLPWVHI